ncbi:UNVERIFIED_ORG: putative nucleotide-binding protein [Burkholderia sp. 1595]|uniref:Nucleotide-binding protein n=1 Tax=Paraburkholderia terricola TaxID=169427 RepID=A0ABU1LT10_9BURK|nr:TIR domain-containing protein [Paraburkholderia terricola]MDR6409676.1 putative nucleotide-binding protein [Paraburkholderia terricola]
MSQDDVPAYSITEALRVPQAIIDHYGSSATAPIDVASALNLQPASSIFRMLCGAALAYGLTDASAKAASIAPTELAKRILNPLAEGDDLLAKREAVMKPRVLKEFLSKYSGNAVPREDIGQNVLRSMGVPADRAAGVWTLILETADAVGYIRKIKDKSYVHLGAGTAPAPLAPSNGGEQGAPIPDPAFELATEVAAPPAASAPSSAVVSTPVAKITAQNRKVFITHGKNMAFIEPIKKLLGFGEMIPVVSVEKQSVSMPVPDKVMNDMRDCAAAIIHVDGERQLMDSSANEHTVINENVLIEIGAAMALYGRRFILLVRDGVKLPSNLQGLYEVRYQGDTLDGNVTIKLFEAISAMKSTPLPVSE